MMKIIKGKKYDTNTAVKVAEWDNGLGKSDHHAIFETLYKKRTGEFFLYGEGGGLTGYSEKVGDLFTWGEKIIPLTVDAAKAWVESHLDGEEYEKIFDCVDEMDGKKVISLSLSIANIEKLKAVSLEKGLSMSALIDKLIDDL